MGKRGPRPTPQSTLKIHGSRLAKSRDGEPEIPLSRPQKPEWLLPEAAEHWDYLLPQLEKAGLAAELYADALALYCQAFGDLMRAERLIEEHGEIAYSDKGSPYLHPAVNLKITAVNRLAKFGQRFGLTPADVRDVTKVEQKRDALSASVRKRG